MAVTRPSALNRKQRKAFARRLQSADPGLDVMHPNAAGIDVGNSTHYVAVRPDRDPNPVRRFDCFTVDLHRLADWLEQCGVTTVAMQSTGVYWIPLYEILDARGLEVYLVNARHTKNLPGRKSDVQESQWLLKLHTYGLLRNSFHPAAAIRVIRTYWRQRADHVRAISTCIQRMQKTLTQMNIQLANVISDLSGWTVAAIDWAAAAGVHLVNVSLGTAKAAHEEALREAVVAHSRRARSSSPLEARRACDIFLAACPASSRWKSIRRFRATAIGRRSSTAARCSTPQVFRVRSPACRRSATCTASASPSRT